MNQEDSNPLEGLAPHQIAALQQGRGVIVGTEVKTLADFGLTPQSNIVNEQSLQLANAALERQKQENDALRQRIQVLEAQQGSSDEMQTKVTDLETKLNEANAKLANSPQGSTVDVSLYEPFLPNSKSEIEGSSLAKLKALATIRGVAVEGDDKAAFVAALLPQEGS